MLFPFIFAYCLLFCLGVLLSFLFCPLVLLCFPNSVYDCVSLWFFLWIDVLYFICSLFLLLFVISILSWSHAIVFSFVLACCCLFVRGCTCILFIHWSRIMNCCIWCTSVLSLRHTVVSIVHFIHQIK